MKSSAKSFREGKSATSVKSVGNFEKIGYLAEGGCISGWITKLNRHTFGGINASTRRWFELDGQYMRYFKKPGSKEMGVIVLKHCSQLVKPSQASNAPSFSVDLVSRDRIWTLCFEDDDSYEKWTEVLERRIQSRSGPPKPESEHEINQLYWRLLDELAIPEEKREEMMQTEPVDRKWMMICAHWSLLQLQEEQGNADESEPSYWAARLEELSAVEGSEQVDLNELRHFWRVVSTSPKQWLSAFFDVGGMESFASLMAMVQDKHSR